MNACPHVPGVVCEHATPNHCCLMPVVEAPLLDDTEANVMESRFFPIQTVPEPVVTVTRSRTCPVNNDNCSAPGCQDNCAITESAEPTPYTPEVGYDLYEPDSVEVDIRGLLTIEDLFEELLARLDDDMSDDVWRVTALIGVAQDLCNTGIPNS